VVDDCSLSFSRKSWCTWLFCSWETAQPRKIVEAAFETTKSISQVDFSFKINLFLQTWPWRFVVLWAGSISLNPATPPGDTNTSVTEASAVTKRKCGCRITVITMNSYVHTCKHYTSCVE
jgi:hypothetical protein